MVCEQIAVQPVVAVQYEAGFYEPFTTLAWLAGITERVRLGTTVLIAPYRHPLLVARMAANLDQLSGGRLVLGVGGRWASPGVATLGAGCPGGGRPTDHVLAAVRRLWGDSPDF